VRKRLTQENPETYLKEVVSSIKLLSKNAQKEAFKRGLDVLTEVNALKPYTGGIHTLRDIAREEFRASVQRYLIGYFDDSIHHSTISVETGLLIRLEETLTEEEKKQLHDKINGERPLSFTFGVIFDEAKRKERRIVEDKGIEHTISRTIGTRNTHIHGGNLTAASILSMQQKGTLEIKNGLAQLERLEKRNIAKLIAKDFMPQARAKLIETQNDINNLPSLEWCTQDKHREKTKKELDAYFTDIFAKVENLEKNMETITDKVRIGLHSKEIIREITSDTYHKRKALETIHESFIVLRYLGFFGIKQAQ
jgi:hypothetical protein